MKSVIKAEINGVLGEFETTPGESLTDFLRRHGLPGVKKGCGEGTCGSCMVLLNDKAVNSCLIPAIRIDNQKIVTIEGLGTVQNPHPLQKSYAEKGAVQCGFCSPGSIISAAALLKRNPHPSEAEVRQAIEGNLCRCTGYKKKIEAVLAAVEQLNQGGAPHDNEK